MRSLTAITALLLSLGLSGCVSYAVFIGLSRPDVEASPLTLTEAREVAEIVGETAREFRLMGGIDERAVGDCSEDRYCEGRIIASYGGEVIVTVFFDKSRGIIEITIRNFHSFYETDFMTKLEEALKVALGKKLPSVQIEVQKHREFPNLGP